MMDEETFDKLGLLAARRYELFQGVINIIEEQEQVDEEERTRVKKVITEMPNTAFVTDDELDDAELDPRTTVEDLDIDIQALVENLGYEDILEENS